MLLRWKRCLYPSYVNFSKRFLSNEIKEVLNVRLQRLPSDISDHQLQLAFVSKNLNALNLDFFVNNLDEHEDRSGVVLDMLANLRATKLANTCLESTHFSVVRHLLENLTLQEVVAVLVDRIKYGIFLNNFTGFAVAQALHEEKEYILGLPLVIKLILADETDSAFVHGFCLKASLEYLKKEQSDKENANKETSVQKKGKIEEKKVRVRFIRNVTEPDVHNEIGKALFKTKSKYFENNNRTNIEILNHVLTKNYDDLDKALSAKSIDIYDEIGDICEKLLLGENQTEFADRIAKLRSKSSFDNFIDTFLKEVSIKETVALAEKQKELFPIWQQVRTQRKLEFDKEMEEKSRKENIEAISKEIAEKKDLLWFFEQEDKHDLEIYKKRKLYKKKSVDSKKKSRSEDEHYVPPQIRKID